MYNKVLETSIEKGMLTRFWSHDWLLILSYLWKEPWPLFTVTISVDYNSFILIINLIFHFLYLHSIEFQTQRQQLQQLSCLIQNVYNKYFSDTNIVVNSESNTLRPSYASTMSVSEVLIDLCPLFTPPIPPPLLDFCFDKKWIVDAKYPVDPHPPSELITVHNCLIVVLFCRCVNGHPHWRKHPLVCLHVFCSHPVLISGANGAQR